MHQAALSESDNCPFVLVFCLFFPNTIICTSFVTFGKVVEEAPVDLLLTEQ